MNRVCIRKREGRQRTRRAVLHALFPELCCYNLNPVSSLVTDDRSAKFTYLTVQLPGITCESPLSSTQQLPLAP